MKSFCELQIGYSYELMIMWNKTTKITQNHDFTSNTLLQMLHVVLKNEEKTTINIM